MPLDYCRGIKEIQPVLDSSRQGLKAGTTWRPGWPHQKCQECQEDPRLGDFGGDGSLDGVIVGVTRRFNMFWIPPDKG